MMSLLCFSLAEAGFVLGIPAVPTHTWLAAASGAGQGPPAPAASCAVLVRLAAVSGTVLPYPQLKALSRCCERNGLRQPCPRVGWVSKAAPGARGRATQADGSGCVIVANIRGFVKRARWPKPAAP